MSDETVRDADVDRIVKPFENMTIEPGLTMRKRVVEELARLVICARDERDAFERRTIEAEAHWETLKPSFSLLLVALGAFVESTAGVIEQRGDPDALAAFQAAYDRLDALIAEFR